jgi:Fis family transcriptional regulator
MTDQSEKGQTLAQAVRQAVEEYLTTMDDQQIDDLYELVLTEVEQPLLQCLLKHTRDNQSRTAQILGLNRGTLRKKLKRYGML